MSVVELHPSEKVLLAHDNPGKPLDIDGNSRQQSPLLQAANSDSVLTPGSASIKGAYSDKSETCSSDTVPSSIGEESHNASANTLTHMKLKDSESDMVTMIDGAIAHRHDKPVTHTDGNTPNPAKEKPPVSEPPTNSLPTNPLHANKDSNNTNDTKLENTSKSVLDGKAVENTLSCHDERASLISPNNSRRHTSPSIISANRYSVDTTRINLSDHVDRPSITQFHSVRRITTIFRNGSRESNHAAVDPDNRKISAPDSEVSRMKSALIRQRIQKRRETTEETTYIVGNKISEGHQNFVTAYNMLTGIRVAVSICSGVSRRLTDDDFRATKKLSFDMDGSELTPSSKYDFKFKDYSPEVFRELRSLFGIDPADYLMSITGKYILSELGSSGKSGSFFYYSRDFRFIIKTIHHSEHKQLRRMLKDYYLHVKNNPNTLVSQFYGLHRLKVHGGIKRVHFIVMNNLFPPHRDIHVKYDLKGSTWGRMTKIPKELRETQEFSKMTLKDLNWLENHDSIKFGPDKRKIFIQQLEEDVKLLKKINVMDYSLLLGIHDVSKGNEATHTTKLSVFDPKSPLKAEVVKTNPRGIDRGVDLPTDVFPGRSKYIFYGHNGGIRATNENNEPLPEIYYLGIIDCLTNYSLKKRLETIWRSLSHNRSTISAVPAKEYGDRFVKFIKKAISDKKMKTN